MDLMKQAYLDCAKGLNLGNLTNVKTGKDRVELVNKCANGYLEATASGDELKRSQYMSALMLLFWGEASKMQNSCRNVPGMEYEDFISQLYFCIENAMEYKAWTDGTKNAEQCIRASIAARGAAAILYESNLDKHKANVNAYSLDVAVSNDNDTATTMADTIEDASANNHVASLQVRLLIQSIIDSGDLVGSIILDNIAFGSSMKTVKETKTAIDFETGKEFKYSVGRNEFSDRELVKTLGSLDSEYIEYFLNNYTVKEQAIQAAVNDITTVNNNKLYKMIHKTLNKERALLNYWINNN